MKCEECGGKIIKKDVKFSMYGVDFGKFPAEVCAKCGEELFEESAYDEINRIAKKKGLYGLEAKTKVGVAGNCLDIRVNSRIAKFLNLKKGEEVTIKPEDKHKLVVEIA